MEITPPVDQYGNISFNRDEGLSIPYTEFSNGAQVNLTGHTRTFSLNKGAFTKALVPNPDNALGLLLLLTIDDLHSITYAGLPFSVVDPDGAVPVVVWEGTIRERNLSA